MLGSEEAEAGVAVDEVWWEWERWMGEEGREEGEGERETLGKEVCARKYRGE